MAISSINQKYINNQNQINYQNQPQSIKTKDLPNDTVELSNKKDHKSKIKKTLLVLGGFSLFALSCFADIYGGLRLDAKKIKILSEHIDFKPAKTLEEAIEFAKSNFKIEKVEGFKKEDLDIINWINRDLTKINNLHKGKLYMPDSIIYSDKITSSDNIEGIASMGTAWYNDTLSISKTEYQNLISQMKETVLDPESKFDEEIKKLAKENKITIMGYLKLFSATGMNTDEAFNMIFHEMGHLQHKKNIKQKDFELLRRSGEITKKIPEKIKKLREAFYNSNNITSQISDYATSSPNEFIAETYSKICAGVEISDEVLELYKKLGGVIP